MGKIIRTLFGLRQNKAGEEAPTARPANRYEHWLAAELAVTRQCSSIPDLTSYLAHANGYLREAALGRAVELASPELLPPITARLNDWVPQVRRAAKNALLTLAPSMPADALLAQLPAIHQLCTASREDHAAWVERFELLLLDTNGPGPVIESIHADAIRIARACFRVVHTHSLLPAETLLKQALVSPDIRIAMEAIGMVRGLPEALHHTLYLTAFGSSFGAVRTAALRALLATSYDEHEPLARTCLFDVQASVRSVAGSYLQRRGIATDALYVEALRDPQADAQRIRICLLALASIGKAEHARVMEAHATSAVPRVQMAALMGWVRLEPSEKDRIAVLALQSAVPRVRKLSMVLIHDFGAYVPVATALAMAEGHGDFRLMLRLSRQEPWTWIETIARIAGSPQLPEGLQAVLAHNLLAWLASASSLYTAPEAHQIALLGNLHVRAAVQALLPRATSPLDRIDYAIAQTRLDQR